MTSFFLILIVALLLVASLTMEDFIFKLLYLLAGAFLLGRLWSSRSIRSVKFQRKFVRRAFPKEEVPVRLELVNQSILPVVWLKVQDLLPVEISPSRSFNQIVSLGPKETITLNYHLVARKRGYYPVGPMKITTGDVLGLAQEEQAEISPSSFTVYPRVIPLDGFTLPSHSPMGTMKHTQPVYEDPTRPAGKRDYVHGDSLRRIDWKSTATTGRLQVKQFEPSISVAAAIFLNLNLNEYTFRRRIDATELAIVAAASIASWAITKKQSAGLYTNGADPLGISNQAVPAPPRKGRAHLMRLLETMARLKALETDSLAGLIRHYRNRLTWGTTMVVITGQAGDDLFDEFFQAQRAGMDIVLILCGELPDLKDIRSRARRYGIPVYAFWSEQDLEHWRVQ